MLLLIAASVGLATSPLPVELPQPTMLAQIVAAQQAAGTVQYPQLQPDEMQADADSQMAAADFATGAAADAPEQTEAKPAAEPQEQTTDAADGTIVVTGSSETIGRDPLVELNEAAFDLTQDVDQAFVEPVAEAYEKGLPKPVRKGLRNFFRNLLEPVNFLNYMLQFKPGKAFETLGRFAINSTVGVGGFIDVAKTKPFSLPYRRNGFANTLGYYGVGPGPFLVIPLVGSTTLRDFVGGLLDQSLLPAIAGKPFGTPYYAIPAYTVNSLEFRIEYDAKLEKIRDSDDPYYAMRETYLCNREAEIAALKNKPPPRDCSIEALMSEGAPLVGAGVGVVAGGDLTQQDLEAAASTAIPTGFDGASAAQNSAEMEAQPEPVAPAIIYISEEVVQPI